MPSSRLNYFYLTSALLCAGPAHAAPPPLVAQPDPPARVGRLTHLTGAVSFHTAQQERWSPALANFPVTTGDGIWTEPRARAELDLPGGRAVLDGGTELDVTILDDTSWISHAGQGTLYVNIRPALEGTTTAVQMARGTVTLTPGRFLITVGDATNPTTVTVLDGTAHIAAPNLTLDVTAHQTATLTGAGTDEDPVRGTAGPEQSTPFLTEMLAGEQPAARPTAVAVPPAVALMTGGNELAAYGTWQPAPAAAPQGGPVWYPQVEPGWVPYRQGRWSNVGPWGWTWVDAAPWGFAPFHYGRWFQDGGRWGWAPGFGGPRFGEPGFGVYGPRPFPVFAPALVSFFAFGIGRPIGWVPLGINEPYFPPYRAGLNYIRNVNITNVRNVTTIINNNSVHINNYRAGTINQFMNRGGITTVSSSVMAQSTPVGASLQPVPTGGSIRSSFKPPIAVAPTTLGAPSRPGGIATAPGPAIRPVALRTPGTPTPRPEPRPEPAPAPHEIRPAPPRELTPLTQPRLQEQPHPQPNPGIQSRPQPRPEYRPPVQLPHREQTPMPRPQVQRPPMQQGPQMPRSQMPHQQMLRPQMQRPQMQRPQPLSRPAPPRPPPPHGNGRPGLR